MAVTVAKVADADDVWGRQRVKVRDITFDSSYVQTGEPLNASDVGLSRIYTAEPLGLAITSSGTTAWAVTAKIGTDRDDLVLFVHGQQPADATTTSIAFPDADSTEDLSTFTVRMRFVGV